MQNTFWNNFNILTDTNGSKIAYNKKDGIGPGIIFLHGLNSDRQGTKANHILNYCISNKRPFISFDMFAHGESAGQIKDASLSIWIDNTLQIIDKVTHGPQIIVGSSMGGWVMLHATIKRSQRIKGIIGLAAAPDFTEKIIWSKMTHLQKEEFLKNGFIYENSEYDDSPYIISKKLIEDGRQNLLLNNKINISIPTILIHGQKDNDVPWETSIELSSKINTDDIKTILVKDGSHRLSRKKDLDLISKCLDELYFKILH